MRKKFYIGDFEITVREIIASISITAIMLLFGVLIHGKISEHQMDRNEIYNKAVKIESKDLFQYGMDTNIGNAFVYGELKAVDTVTYPEIGGEYMSVKKETEQYTRHTKTVYEYDDDGDIVGSHEEVYYTWDNIRNEKLECKKVTFLDIEFDYGQIYEPYRSYIKTVYDRYDSDIRYLYYGSETSYQGTIFADLRNKTISKGTRFYNNMTIEESVKYLESGIGGLIVFWLFWIVLIVGCVVGFYYLDNRWLE